MEDGEELLRIGPDSRHPKTDGPGECGEPLDRVLVGVFGDDLLAAFEMKDALTEVNGLRLFAEKMHFDARLLLIVDRAVLPLAEIEIRAELAIGANEEVEVELGGHAGAVVVSRLENFAGLLQIDTDDHTATMTAELGHPGEKLLRQMWFHVANRGAGKEDRNVLGLARWSRQSDFLHVIGADR